MIFSFPYPVSTNRMYRRGSDGRPKLTDAAKLYKEEVAWWAARHRPKLIASGSVAIEIIVHPKRNKDGKVSKKLIDRSNVMKLMEDALQGIAYVNDSQVDRVVIERGDPLEHAKGGLTVTVREWSGPIDA